MTTPASPHDLRRRSVRALTATAAAVTIAVTAAPTTAVAGSPSSAGPVARVWVTTPDGRLRLADGGTIPFGGAAGAGPTITVDPHRTYQTMTGFGASLTDSSAVVLYRLAPADRDAAMVSLFDPRRGDGLSVLRQPMGASDFVVDADYSYDDVPAGQTDFEMRQFSIAHDEKQILPLLRRARALNPKITIIASPWSPPGWMKTSDSMIGGRLKNDPRVYQAYALYFVKFLQAYAVAGVPVDAVTLQNEPQFSPRNYPGMYMSVQEQDRFITVLGPALRQARLRTKILAYDHNWSTHPGDIANTPPGETPQPEYPTAVLSDPAAARWVDGVAYHCYFGTPARQTVLHNAFPRVPIYFTECSGFRGTTPLPQAFSDTLKFQGRNLTIGVARNWAKTSVTWNLALDPDGNPHLGGCAGCTGVIAVNPDLTVTRNAEYYSLGHVSRFVRPGAVRVASTSFGTTEGNGQIMDVAFRNPDGSTALVVQNQNDEPRAFSVAIGRRAFTYTLPGGALATFTWPRSRALDSDLRQLEPGVMTATASPAVPTDPCCRADIAANLIDDDATTRWSTGAGQLAGQYVQVDLGRRDRLSRLVLDSGAAIGEYPRGYAVYLSRDGQNWGRAVATGAGSGQVTTVDLRQRRARYVRVVATESADSRWSVADLRVYRS